MKVGDRVKLTARGVEHFEFDTPLVRARRLAGGFVTRITASYVWIRFDSGVKGRGGSKYVHWMWESDATDAEGNVLT